MPQEVHKAAAAALTAVFLNCVGKDFVTACAGSVDTPLHGALAVIDTLVHYKFQVRYQLRELVALLQTQTHLHARMLTLTHTNTLNSLFLFCLLYLSSRRWVTQIALSTFLCHRLWLSLLLDTVTLPRLYRWL